MLEKPDLADSLIIDCLHDQYGLRPTDLAFLPLGADARTAVYRASDGQEALFVKLRREAFNPVSVLVPYLLHESGIDAIIAPLPNRVGQLWVSLYDYHLVLYPFVEGTHGFERELSPENWVALGHALRQIHSADVPPNVLGAMPEGTFSPHGRLAAMNYQRASRRDSFSDPVAAALAALLCDRQAEIDALIEQADRLACVLEHRRLPHVICHADIHVGNVLVTPAGRLYIVDWDTLKLAPKEQDLMFPGAGIGPSTLLGDEEQAALFYEGYDAVECDREAIAYFRCERIVQDVCAYCEQILHTSGENPDRQQGLRQLENQFWPGGVVERAHQSVATAG